MHRLAFEAAAFEAEQREKQLQREAQIRPFVVEFQERMNPTCPTCNQAFEKTPGDCIAIRAGHGGGRCPEFCEICLEVNPCSGHRGAHGSFTPQEVRRARLPVLQRRLQGIWMRVPINLREEFRTRITLDVIQLGLGLPK